MDFNGTNALVSIADASDLDFTDHFTLEAWVRPDTLRNWFSPISKASWTGGMSGYTLAADYQGKPTGIAMAAGASTGVAGPNALPTSAWSHLAFTSDGTTLRLYADPNATRLLDTFEFDEFGNPRERMTLKYGWLGGKQRRTELPSGVIQMGVRSYVPMMGRFISVDPIVGGSANTYDYANQDPVNTFDLTGQAACSAVLASPVLRYTGNPVSVTVTYSIEALALCSRNAKDRHLSVQIQGGYIRLPQGAGLKT